MIVDDDSPPGSWAKEMERMPWRYSEQVKINDALATMRLRGMHYEASLIAQEINVLRAEIEALKKS